MVFLPKALLYSQGRLLCLLVLALLSMVRLNGPVLAQAEDQGARGQWGLAEHLFQSGEYYRAITEYKRFLYYFPREGRANAASLRIVEAYVRGQWWQDGIEAAQEALSRGLHDEQKAWVLFLRGVCEAQLGRLEEARRSFRAVTELSKDPQLRDRAQYLIGETFAVKHEWEDAAEAFERMTPQGTLFKESSRSAGLIRRETPLPEKSPWWAGILAALTPGAGHLYTERWKDAGLVFAVNAAFIGATVEAIQKDNPPLAGGLAAVELLWYSGNVFSAVGSAHKYNRRLRRELFQEIHLPGAWLGPPASLKGGGWRQVQ